MRFLPFFLGDSCSKDLDLILEYLDLLSHLGSLLRAGLDQADTFVSFILYNIVQLREAFQPATIKGR